MYIVSLGVHCVLLSRAFQAEKLEQLAQVFKVLDHTSYFLSLSSLGIRYSYFSTLLHIEH